MNSWKMPRRNRNMYIQSHDFLAIHPSASKPSLVSSFWSINVQTQPLEKMELDLKCLSQASLPDAFDLKPNPIRSTKSMSDLHLDDLNPTEQSSSQHPCVVEGVPNQENLTNRVNSWLNESPASKESVEKKA